MMTQMHHERTRTDGDKDIREIYNYICNNYVDGDEIILTGFSRGAFTARSVADMISSVGLLVRALPCLTRIIHNQYGGWC